MLNTNMHKGRILLPFLHKQNISALIPNEKNKHAYIKSQNSFPPFCIKQGNDINMHTCIYKTLNMHTCIYKTPKYFSPFLSIHQQRSINKISKTIFYSFLLKQTIKLYMLYTFMKKRDVKLTPPAYMHLNEKR